MCYLYPRCKSWFHYRNHPQSGMQHTVFWIPSFFPDKESAILVYLCLYFLSFIFTLASSIFVSMIQLSVLNCPSIRTQWFIIMHFRIRIKLNSVMVRIRRIFRPSFIFLSFELKYLLVELLASKVEFCCWRLSEYFLFEPKVQTRTSQESGPITINWENS